MKKNMIALAVLGALAAPAAMAQSANPVTLYGRVYALVENVSAAGVTSSTGALVPAIPARTVVQDGNTYIGFRGTEDLGGGLKAWFQVESTGVVDVGGGLFANRNSGVGLQGPWGSFLIGRWDSPFKNLELAVDPTGELTVADPEAIIGDKNAFTRRPNNNVQYWTPNMAGFSMRFSYVANEGKLAATATASAVNPYDVGFHAQYAPSGSPISGGYAWEKHHDQAGATATSGIDEKGQLLYVKGQFGGFMISAMGQRFNKQTKVDTKVSLFTSQYDMGPHSFWALYGRTKGGQALTPSTLVAPEGKMAAIGYYYNFSKRTTFVAVYSKITNNAAANYTFNSNASVIAGGPALALDQDPRGFGVGIRHLF
ncbi:MAG: porin [Betaproteobacteria bacterium]|nr:porin [Betaproteobacteria bacterium]